MAEGRLAQTVAELRAAGALQAGLCRENGSPTYAAIIDAILAQLGDTGAAVSELLLTDRREPVDSALYLRLLSAAMRVALRDESNPLREFYPILGGTVDLERVVPCFFEVVAANVDAVAAGVPVDIQTNEIGRAAPLSAAMNYLAQRWGRPLRLLEVGASAGLNMWLDRYRVSAAGNAWGPADSPVRLDGQFVEGSPPPGGFTVATRRGCDLNPLDITMPATRCLLRSFVWPEHVQRQRRLDAALRIVPSAPIDRSDATTWVSDQLAGQGPEPAQPDEAATVVYHSMVMPYLAPDERVRFEAEIRAAGERISGHRVRVSRTDGSGRLAWIALEPTDQNGRIQLRCERWPERERVVLATCTPHGERVRWCHNG